jgi:hypothetical protein
LSLYTYLKDACDQLTIVDPDVYATYDVRGFVKLGALRQSGYKVTSDDPRKTDKFSLSFACKQPDQIKLQVEGQDWATQQKEFVSSCNLRLTSKVTRDGGGVFLMDAYIPVSFEFEADFDNARINMSMRNVDMLGSSRVAFEPDQYMRQIEVASDGGNGRGAALKPKPKKKGLLKSLFGG